MEGITNDALITLIKQLVYCYVHCALILQELQNTIRADNISFRSLTPKGQRFDEYPRFICATKLITQRSARIQFYRLSIPDNCRGILLCKS